MAEMIIHGMDENLKGRLRTQAALHGRSMEAEARDILRTALSCHAVPQSKKNLLELIRARVDPIGGIELEIPARNSASDAARP